MDSDPYARGRWQKDLSTWISLNRIYRADESIGTVHPRHIILATGQAGEPYLPSNITGLDEFKGDRLLHSSQFIEPKKNVNGNKAVIVGCCNSGHDIARDYHDHGYDVTMVQRSSTLVLTSHNFHDVTMKGLYAEDGVHFPASMLRGTLTYFHLISLPLRTQT